MRGEGSYLRCVGRTPEERKEQRKAARLSLDTSAHAGSEYRRFVRECSVVRSLVFLWRPAMLYIAIVAVCLVLSRYTGIHEAECRANELWSFLLHGLWEFKKCRAAASK